MSNLQNIFNELNPTKISYARRLKMGAYGWGVITNFYLDSVKINFNTGKLRSAAVINVKDKAGQVTILLEGSQIATLFNLTPEKWKEIEQMATKSQDLFYRYFKLGLSDNFPVQQQVFYYFCLTNQTTEPFFISFQRVPNTRRGEKLKAFLKVIESKSPTPALLRNYFEKYEKIKEEKEKS